MPAGRPRVCILRLLCPPVCGRSQPSVLLGRRVNLTAAGQCVVQRARTVSSRCCQTSRAAHHRLSTCLRKAAPFSHTFLCQCVLNELHTVRRLFSNTSVRRAQVLRWLFTCGPGVCKCQALAFQRAQIEGVGRSVRRKCRCLPSGPRLVSCYTGSPPSRSGACHTPCSRWQLSSNRLRLPASATDRGLALGRAWCLPCMSAQSSTCTEQQGTSSGSQL